MHWPPRGNRIRWYALWVLACLALVEFSVRGPVRALAPNGRDFNDFISPYTQTRAWISGRDPYALATLCAMWPASSRPPFVLRQSNDGTLPGKTGLPSPYPPPTFPLLLPLAELPWRVAMWAWAALSLLGIFTVAWVLVEIAPCGWRNPLALLITASVLLFAPVQTAVALSNLVSIALAVGLLAALCQMRGLSIRAGVLLAVAVALKPTVALPFVIFALVSRNRNKSILAAVVAGAVLLGVTALPLHGSLWWTSFLEISHRMFAPGAINDFSTENPLRFQLINLQTALFPILEDRTRTQIATWMVFTILIGFWLRAVNRDGEVGLLDLAILASAALLPVYHRFTDAGLLLLPISWALRETGGEKKKYARATLVLASPFLLPGAAILRELSERTEYFGSFSRTRVWDILVLPHEAWLILALCIVLVAARLGTKTTRYNETT